MYTQRHCNRSLTVTRVDGRATKIRGHAAVWYDPADPGTEYAIGDIYRERIMPGAFQRAIAANRSICCPNHDRRDPLGRQNRGTLRIWEDDVGLAYEVDLPEHSRAQSHAEAVERGDYEGSSFDFGHWDPAGYRDQRTDGIVTRTVTSFPELRDVGPVTDPAYKATSAEVRDICDTVARQARLAAWRLARCDMRRIG